MRDFYLRLPSGVALTHFTILGKYSDVPTLVQEAVVLLLLHDSDDLKVSGEDFMTAIRTTTTGAIQELGSALSPVADALVNMLNESEYRVTAIEFLLSSTDSKLRVDINITSVSGDVQTGTIYQG